MPHKCPVTRCKTIVQQDYLLMCEPHWRALSWEIQQRVLRAWQDLCRRGPDGAPLATAAEAAQNREAWRRARLDAIEHVDNLIEA